jgi:hypothetical protein
MSSEIQLLIETLTATREDVAGVREQIEKKTVAGPTLKALQTEVAQLKGSLVGLTAASIRNAAETGAKATAADLSNATSALRMAAQEELETRKALGRWKVAAIALAAFLSLLAAFVGGAAFMKSGLPLTTEAGCSYLGGDLGSRPDGRSLCYFWIQ